jgi:hypothetical protein
MKEIMASHSSHFDQGVPSFEYSPVLANMNKLFEDALDVLQDDLVAQFAGQRLAMIDIYHRHNLRKPYVKKNYKDALTNLLKSGRVATDRVPRSGTFSDHIIVSFPATSKARQ